MITSAPLPLLSRRPLTFIAVRPVPGEDAAVDDLRDAALAGLSQPPGLRTLPCRFFYDAVGSELFEKICDLPEYYPTRTERALFAAHANDIIATAAGRKEARTGVSLVEFGSGSSVKTRLLLDALMARQPLVHYAPIDISAEFLRESAEALLADYGEPLRITAIAGEYQAALPHVPSGDHGDGARLFLFLGGNIGNFAPNEAAAFLASVRARMRPADTLLLGAAMQTGTARMEAAYNDSAGVTARFNKNLLARLNREAGSDFDLDKWSHHAPYVEQHGRIEMRLVSVCDQTVRFAGDRAAGTPDREFTFGKNESIHTENSHKYTANGLATIWTRAGFDLVAQWTDAQNFFTVSLLAPGGK